MPVYHCVFKEQASVSAQTLVIPFQIGFRDRHDGAPVYLRSVGLCHTLPPLAPLPLPTELTVHFDELVGNNNYDASYVLQLQKQGFSTAVQHVPHTHVGYVIDGAYSVQGTIQWKPPVASLTMHLPELTLMVELNDRYQ